MANSDAVWGIDIGQSALKALRCRPHDKADRVIADAFDYVEYRQILSEPGADADELVGDALKTFLSRNSVKNDRVVVAVPGQNGLARFIKLPPVEASKIPDIVRYEARQQIPFDLKEVVWDFQRMGAGAVEEGFALETEIGLFAMKRDQVAAALAPFDRAAVDVDVVQLAPLALYNFIVFDQLYDVPPPDQVDESNPLPWVMVLSVGTESSDLVATNGHRVWQRSIPIGGNHFTKSLVSGLKLAFAKAEHLKRNASAAQDPKAIFSAMRGVFNDLLTEVNRSINYFSNNVERNANVQRIVAVGNATKLPGLRKYLEQNLGLEVARVENYRGLVGSSVVTAPAFQENLTSFAVAYGLALQGLKKAPLGTNLLPREVATARLIREKKPWAVGLAALLMLGTTVSFLSHARAVGTVATELFSAAESRVKQVSDDAGRLKTEVEQARTEFTATDKIGQNLVGNVEGRLLWLELLRAINQCLPIEPAPKEGEAMKEIEARNQLHLTSVECQWSDNLANWFAPRMKAYKPGPGEKPPPADAAPAADPSSPMADQQPPEGGQPDAAPAEGQPAEGEAPAYGPSGPGWIVRLAGLHFHNSRNERENFGPQFVRNTLIRALQTGKVSLPTPDGKLEQVSMKELGVGFPVLIDTGKIDEGEARNPFADSGDAKSGGGNQAIPVRVYRFEVQMAWKPVSPSQRLENQRKAAEAAATPP